MIAEGYCHPTVADYMTHPTLLDAVVEELTDRAEQHNG